MKIVIIDNYDRENTTDLLVCENVHPLMGELICELLNKEEPDSSPCYFTVKPDDYELRQRT